jgi:hypothetical protein
VNLIESVPRSALVAISNAISEAKPVAAFDALRNALAPEISKNLQVRTSYQSGQVTSVTIEAVVHPDLIKQALALLDRFSEPALGHRIVDALNELRLITRSRELSEIDLVAQTRCYGVRLRQYPADVAIAAVRGWAEKSSWFPSWHELQVELDRLNAGRFHLRLALVSKLKEWEQGPEKVQVRLPNGAKLEIQKHGDVDETWAPRDCPQTHLTPKEAREIYERKAALLKAEALKSVNNAKPMLGNAR